MRDLGLSYDEALHGVQTAIKYELEKDNRNALDIIKHLRVGLDARGADAQGLASLLIQKGVFTLDEYLEYMRIAMNEELARYTQHCRETYGLPDNVDFR